MNRDEFIEHISEAINEGQEVTAALEWGTSATGHNNAMQEHIDALVAEYDRLTAWIPVSNRLPEKETFDIGEEYLCVLDWYGEPKVVPMKWIGERWYTTGKFSADYTEMVAHWRPLPEPPEVT